LPEAALRGRGAIDTDDRKELEKILFETEGAGGGAAEGLVAGHEGFPQVAVARGGGREGGRGKGREGQIKKSAANAVMAY